ncbi:MAG: sugar phosphate isomerase/epimerase, partial [Clostridia bacterium]|nr:sugar phosphate isomerase/epimerase [Clostridia bacterium]
MKIGVCAPPQYWAAAKELGYDHVEWNFSVIANYTEEQMTEYLAQKDALGLDIPSCNGFFPGGFVMFGENREEIEAWAREYARAGFARAAKFGANVAVMGSGYARNVPEGMDIAEAKERFASLMRILGEEGEKYGVRVAIEPLQKKETNFLHTLEEGAEICAMVNHPNVGLTLDVFHFWAGGEPLENIEKYKQYVFHAHLARPAADRKAPTEADADMCFVYRDAMRAIGYDDKISLEP